MERVGPYELVERLGRGTFAIVHRARHRDTGREVALKILDPLDPDPAALARFEREARISGQLVDPAIPTIHEIGTDGERHFIAMELVEGRRLDDLLLAEGPLPVERVSEIATQLARALGAAHALGVVHRDVKPANLVLTPDGRLRLLDFGLSHMVGVHSLSEPGVLVGTVPYMSPEQLLGQTVDARSDLYSASVVLFELLAGGRPFPGDRFETVTHAILHVPPPRIPDVGAVEWVVRKGLAKRPDDRYPSAEAMLRDWELVSLQPEASSTSLLAAAHEVAPREPDDAVPFRGRESVVDRIAVALSHADDGRGQLVAVGSEPGGGRSRVLREAHEVAGRVPGRRVIQVDGRGGGLARPLHLWTAVIDAVIEEGITGGTPDRRAALAALGPGLRIDLLELLATPEATDPDVDAPEVPDDFGALVEAMRGFLDALTAGRPLVLLVDDLERIDPASRRVLASFVPTLPTRRMSVVVAVRNDRPPRFSPEGDEVGDVLAAARSEEALVELSLPRLSPEIVAEIASIRYGSDPSIAAMAARVHEESEGTPILVVELFRFLEVQGKLAPGDDGRWVADDLGDVPIPSRIADLFEQRLAGLDDDDRELLSVMAITGTPARARVLATCMDTAPLAVLRRLRRVEEHGLVVSGGDGYHFVQTKLGEYLRAQLPDEMARAVHLQAAEGMIRLEGSERVEPMEVAEHLLAADEPARATPFLERAGDRQVQLFANEAGLATYERALEILEDLDDPALLPARCRLGRRIATVQMRLGRAEEAVLTGSLHVRLARRTGDPALLGQLLLTLGEARVQRGEEESALEAARRARAAFAEAGDRSGQARAVDLEGRIEQRREHLPEALELFHEALSLRDGGTDGEIGKSRYLLGMCYRATGRLDEAASMLAEAKESLQRAGDVVNLAAASGELGNVHFVRGDYDRAAEEYGRFLRVMRQSGERARLAIALSNAAAVELRRGRFTVARGLYREALAIRLELGDVRRTAFVQANLAYVFLHQARYRDAILAAHDAAGMAEEVGHAPCHATARAFTGLIHLELGNHDAAWDALEEALDRAPGAEERVTFLGVRAAVSAARGDLDEARAALASASRENDEAEGRFTYEVCMARAAIALAADDLDAAIEAAWQAVELSRDAGDVRKRAEAATCWVSAVARTPDLDPPELRSTLERTIGDAVGARLRGLELRLRIAQAELLARADPGAAAATLKLAFSAADQILGDVPPRSRLGWARRSGYSRALDLLEHWGGDEVARSVASARRRVLDDDDPVSPSADRGETG